MTINLDVINSATKYGSIETYHKLASNRLTEELNFTFEGNVILTEKINGTNGRAILMPDGDYFIGSRKEILYAKGDRRIDPTESIVETMLPLAAKMVHEARRLVDNHWITVFYGEVYGGKVGPAGKQYTSVGATGFRLFDIAYIPMEVLGWPRPNIALWRDGGGQKFANEATLQRASESTGLALTPRKGIVSAEQLPTTLAGMDAWLTNVHAVHSLAMLDGADVPGASEGLVLRTHDRSVIAKARVDDYAAVLRPNQKRRR